jgi:hypothetical protein
MMAPSGATSMLACRYSGLNAKRRLALRSSGLVTNRARLNKVINAFDALRLLPASVHCPSDDGSEILTVLAYPRGRRVRVVLRLTGCQMVFNGNLIRTTANIGGPNPAGVRLLRALKTVLHPHTS